MPTQVIVPKLSDSISEAVLLRWLKSDGETVANGDPIAELETDKANIEIPAEGAGVMKTTAKPGETVQVGQVIGTLNEAGAAAPAPAAPTPAAPTPAAKPENKTPASSKPASASAPAVAAPAPAAAPAAAKTDDLRPSVRRIVEENKLDPASITGTGPGGKITKEDATRQAEAAIAAPPPIIAPPPPVTQATLPAPVPAPTPPPGGRPLSAAVDDFAATPFDATGQKRIPMTKIRKRIAATLVEAQRTAAILTTFNEVDMSQIMALRTKFKERFQEVHGIGLGFMSFFSRAVALALKEFPRVNARIEGDDIIYHSFVNLGIAVSTERGLTVPVLKHAELMGFAKIESEIKRLATAVRDNKIGLQDMTGATFSITNGGVFGSLLSTPILNPPQSGILGMHAIQQRPVAIDGKVEIRPMMYVALSYDHRLVDGRDSVSFLVRVKQYLEDPTRLMLEI